MKRRRRALKPCDCVPAIDLVDGQELADLLKKCELGVHTVKVEKVKVNVDWFN